MFPSRPRPACHGTPGLITNVEFNLGQPWDGWTARETLANTASRDRENDRLALDPSGRASLAESSTSICLGIRSVNAGEGSECGCLPTWALGDAVQSYMLALVPLTD